MKLKHSNQIITAIATCTALTPSESRILAIIANHARKADSGEWLAFPSIETIASLAERSTRSVYTAVKSLQKKGFISVSKSRDTRKDGKKWAHNVYSLVVSKLGFTVDIIKEAKKAAKSFVIGKNKQNKAAREAEQAPKTNTTPLTSLFNKAIKPKRQPVMSREQAAKQAFSKGTISPCEAAWLLENDSSLSATERHQLSFVA